MPIDPIELAKHLPVRDIYLDVAQPAAREVGEALHSVSKVARFAMAPIDYLATFQDRWQRYLKRLSDKVPEDHLIQPHPQLAGPIIEGLKYADEDGILAEMFLSLMARALDKTRVGEAHPAFPLILRQLSPDEAVFLCRVKSNVVRRFETVLSEMPYTSEVTYEIPLESISFPENIDIYYLHLHALNLIDSELNSEPVSGFSEARKCATTVEELVCFTTFGNLFAKACIADEIGL